jgi:hypothetical protein
LARFSLYSANLQGPLRRLDETPKGESKYGTCHDGEDLNQFWHLSSMLIRYTSEK